MTFKLLMHHTAEYLRAVRHDPKGVICSWCHRPNFFFDDCGFFYISPRRKEHGVTCSRCYHGPLGEAHIARYGLGER